MANLKSSQKDVRRIERRTERNRSTKSRLKTLQKNADLAIKSGDSAKAKEAVATLISALDKATKSGVVHPNKVSRHKATLAKVFKTA